MVSPGTGSNSPVDPIAFLRVMDISWLKVVGEFPSYRDHVVDEGELS